MEAPVAPLSRRDDWLVGVAVASTLIASVIAVLWPDVYRDGDWTRARFLAQDTVHLAVALPILLGAWWAGREGRLAPRLVLIAALAHVLHAQGLHVMGARFNELYPLYLVSTGASAFALVAALRGLSPLLQGARTQGRMRQAGAWVLLLVAGLLATLEVVPIALGLVQGVESSAGAGLAAPNSPAVAVDLMVVVPLCVAGGVLSLRDCGLAHLLGPVLLIKTAGLGVTRIGFAVSAEIWAVPSTTGAGLLWGLLAFSAAGLALAWIEQLELRRAVVRRTAPTCSGKARGTLRLLS